MTTASANLRTVRNFVAMRQEFNGSNLVGRKGGNPMTGRLPQGYHAEFFWAIQQSDFYYVMSYGTPIAWFADHTWYVPNVRYSQSTSRQQSALNLVRDGSLWSDNSRRWAYNGG